MADPQDGGAEDFSAKPPRKKKIVGPEVRDTFVHRRVRWMKVDVCDLEEISEYARDDLIPGAVAGFVLSGTLWLGVDKWISDGFSTIVFLLFCVSAVCLAVVWWSSRKLGQTTKRLKKLIESIDEEQDI